MTDLFSDLPASSAPAPKGRRERQVFSVSEFADVLRGLLEDSLPSVWIRGEVSRFNRHSSGHWYFTLKDANSRVECVMFKTRNYVSGPAPKDGDSVLVRGEASFYGPQGKAQIVVEHLEPAGEGALLKAFEELKKKLAAEGLFDDKLKRPLPTAPRHIGIITSSKAAALQDILTTLRRRYPLGTAWIWPVPVQGAAASPAIMRALDALPQRAPVEVIILARGGGSVEDLSCFNHEGLARAIRACKVPVVTGIGHEIDFTIADFAADLRAPTPTGAAERVAPDVADWKARVRAGFQALDVAFVEHVRDAAERVNRAEARLNQLHPGRRLLQHHQRLDELRERLGSAAGWFSRPPREALAAVRHRLLATHPAHRLALLRQRIDAHATRIAARMVGRLADAGHRLRAHDGLLQSLAPQRVLERGYAIAQSADGTVLLDAAGVAAGDAVAITLARGRLETEVVKARAKKD